MNAVLKMDKPRLSVPQIVNMNVGFLGIQFSFELQQSNMSPIYPMLGAEGKDLPYLLLAGPIHRHPDDDPVAHAAPDLQRSSRRSTRKRHPAGWRTAWPCSAVRGARVPREVLMKNQVQLITSVEHAHAIERGRNLKQILVRIAEEC